MKVAPHPHDKGPALDFGPYRKVPIGKVPTQVLKDALHERVGPGFLRNCLVEELRTRLDA